MKIAYVLNDYTAAAGIERVISMKANYLAANGYEVCIVTLCHRGAQPFFSFDPRITFHDLGLPSGEDMGLKDEFVGRLSALLNEIKPDITISTGRKLMFHVCEATDASRKVLEIHFNKYTRKLLFSRFEKYLLARPVIALFYRKLHRLVKRYDSFVVLTWEDMLSWRRMGLRNAWVIYNPLPFIPGEPSKLDTKRIIAMGRHEYQKGFDDLVKIWAGMEREYSEWTLTIVGEGRKKARLEALIARLGIAGRVELKPPVKDVAAEYARSSVFAMTSRYEGFGLVLAEAMICGVPPIAYACKCGPRDLIRDGGNGILVDFHNPRRFARKLRTLLDSDELRHRLGSAARESAMALDINIIMPQWTALFEELAGEKQKK